MEDVEGTWRSVIIPTSELLKRKKTFVPASETQHDEVEEINPKRTRSYDPETGLEVQQIYREIISQPSKNKSRSKKSSKNATSPQNNDNNSHTTIVSKNNLEHSFFCETCQEWIDIRAISKVEHLRSVPHLISDAEKPSVNTYAQWWSSKGYQILKDIGWDEEHPGLGRNHEGRTQPIPTQLKTDKKGLGHVDNQKNPPRITHFRAFEVPFSMKIEKKAPKLNKIQKKMLEKKQKERDRRLHMYMHS